MRILVLCHGNACRVFGGNSTGTCGNGTRMCIYIHPGDCAEAEEI